MARQAKIYFQDQLAGILVEGDNGYSFHYQKKLYSTLLFQIQTIIFVIMDLC